MEESLRNLADLLGQYSRLVSQVLAIGSSSANWNVTDSDTHRVSGNNFSSTSNVACCKEVEVQVVFSLESMGATSSSIQFYR